MKRIPKKSKTARPSPSEGTPKKVVPGAGPPTPAMARDLPELLYFRDRALAGEVETTRPTVMSLDLESSSLQEACLATLAGLRGMTVVDLIRDYLARGYEADLVSLGRKYCPERRDLFMSDDADEASQGRVARVIRNLLMDLPLQAGVCDQLDALAGDLDGGQIRLELFDAINIWRSSLVTRAIALCAQKVGSEGRKARRAGDVQVARAMGRLHRQIRNLPREGTPLRHARKY